MSKRRITPVGWVILIAIGLLPAAAVTVGLLKEPVVTLCVVALLGVFAAGTIMSMRENRSLFLASRSPMSNEDFAAALGVRPGDRRLCDTIRAALGEGYDSWPPEVLRPDDVVYELAERFSSTPFDVLGVVLALEANLGIKVSKDLASRLCSRRMYNYSSTIAELVRHMISVLREEMDAAASR